MEKTIKKRKSFIYKTLRFSAWLLVSIVILVVLLLLFIRSPWGQNILVQRAVKYVSNKTHTEVAIEKLFISLDGNILLKGLYLEDQQGDTLVYSKSLELDIPIIPILRGNEISIKNVDWQGLHANIIEEDTSGIFNFQFLIDAFVSESDTKENSVEVTANETTEPIKLTIGNIRLRDFDLYFDGASSGIVDSQVKFEELEIAFDEIDLEKMDFRLKSTYLTDAAIVVNQIPIAKMPEEEDELSLPYLELGKISFKEVKISYTSDSDLNAEVNLGVLRLEVPKVDLKNKEVLVDVVHLKNTDTKIYSYSNSEKPIEIEEESSSESFSWPAYLLDIKEIDLSNNSFEYVVDSAKVKKDIFNPNSLHISDFNFYSKNIFLHKEEAGFQLKQFSFKEASGINLKEFTLDFAVNDKQIYLDKLKLRLNNHRLSGNTKIHYSSLAQLIDKPENARIALNLPDFQIDIRDAFRLDPELRKNEALNALSKRYVKGDLQASGGLSKLELPKAFISWNNTTIQAIATLENLMDIDKLAFDVKEFQATTKKEDLLAFIEEEDLELDLPEDIALVGTAKGNLNNMEANAELTTTQGLARASGHWIYEEEIDFSAEVEIVEYRLNELLQDEAFGALSFNLSSYGSGPDIHHLDVDLDAKLLHFSYQDYQIDSLRLAAVIKEGVGKLTSEYKDRYLDYTLDSDIVLDSISPQANIHFDLKGANLKKLGLTDRDIRATFKLDADFDGKLDSYDVIATIGDGLFIAEDKSYLLGDVLATAHVEQDTTSIWVDNKIARLQLESNATPQHFASSIKTYIMQYFSKSETSIPEGEEPVKMFVKGEINEDPLLNRVLLMKVEKLDTVSIDIDYNEAERKLLAAITAPLINYDGNEIHNLAFQMNAMEEKFDFSLGFDNIKAGVFDLPKTSINGEQQGEELFLNFNATHQDQKLVHLPWVIYGTTKALKLRIPEEDILLNAEKWEVPKDNEVQWTEEGIFFHNFQFTKGKEVVRYSNDLKPIDYDQIGVAFENFNLNEILGYLNPEENLAKGDLNGDLTLIKPLDTPALLADLSITELELLDVDLGVLTMKARSLGLDKYDFKLGLKEGLVDVDLLGGYRTSESSPEMDLNLRINEFKIEALDGLSMGELRDGKGSFSGSFNLSGPLKDIIYDGKIDFADAGFTVNKFNAPFSLDHTSLSVDNKGLYFDNFQLYDEYKNDLIVDGKILTENILEPEFDLKVRSDNFHVINASPDDNEFIYGKAAFDLDMEVKGSLLLPIVSMRATISDDTDITYIMSSANAAIESRDGVVSFVNREDPNAVLTLREETTKLEKISGIDLTAFLKIGKKAKVTIIIDKQTGDNFQAFGDGEFEFAMKPNGTMTLSGVYTIAGGHYQMNLYNLVNRKFELIEGGRVTWLGDLMDADLDVQAKYEVDASASPLMAAVSSGADQATQNRYRQVLPFQVYLNIGGEIMAPEISFSLDMPEDKQGAIGGQVFGRVQQLNQQEEELNRQVFSLLVMNRFFPDAGSDGGQGGLAFIVRNNINDAISDQLNAFSDKLLGKSGIELDFGLESFTDYQGDSPEERTQLDIAAQKKLFDDRLIMRVGSEVDIVGGADSGREATPIIGNVSLEYLLTPNGKYSLRGFRKNTFDNIIDGQLIESGIALIFTQEYNSFPELIEALTKGETKEEKRNRREQRKADKEKKRKEKELKVLEKEAEKRNN